MDRAVDKDFYKNITLLKKMIGNKIQSLKEVFK
jgi:hypothetical protein